MAAVALRYFTWQVRTCLQSEVETEWAFGLRMIVGSKNKGFNGNIYLGLMEYSEMGLLIQLLSSGDTFVDVGAHLGSYTALASGVCGARTFAFEGARETAELLRRNVRLNGLENLVEILEMAVGDSAGEVDFRYGSDVWNRAAFGTDRRFRSVRMARLDDIEGCSGAVMLKIDTNGTSGKVLAGATETLANPKLLAIRCEDQYTDEAAVLRRFGFERAIYDPAHRILTPVPSDDPGYYPLFVRDFDAVRERIAAAPKRQIMGRWL